jgi:hypothetical protein
MRHKKIHDNLLLIDKFVELYRRTRKTSKLPRKEIKILVEFLFEGSKYLDSGAYKNVYQINSRKRKLALKIGREEYIKDDMESYGKLPKRIRNRYFAKIYWHTKFCLIQKFGKKSKIPPEEIKKLKIIGRKYGLADIRKANILKVDGRFKIVDASLRKS